MPFGMTRGMLLTTRIRSYFIPIARTPEPPGQLTLRSANHSIRLKGILTRTKSAITSPLCQMPLAAMWRIRRHSTSTQIGVSTKKMFTMCGYSQADKKPHQRLHLQLVQLRQLRPPLRLRRRQPRPPLPQLLPPLPLRRERRQRRDLSRPRRLDPRRLRDRVPDSQVTGAKGMWVL